MKAPFFLGRLIFGGFFVYAGVNHFRRLDHTAQYAANKKVPFSKVAVAATGAMLTVGGASIVMGIKPKFGALAIMGFLAGVSPVMHDFWHVQDPAQQQNEMINFAKNMALLGSALALLGVEEPWAVSVPAGKLELGRRFGRLTSSRIAA